MTKPPLLLGRGPRPKLTDDERAAVAAEVKGLAGFGDRPTSSSAPPPAPEPPPAPAPAPVPPAAAPEPAAEAPKKPTRAKPAPKPEAPGWSIKFDVSDEVYQLLLLESRRKRTTLKYLMLEILAERGLPVDLEKASKDGRRER